MVNFGNLSLLVTDMFFCDKEYRINPTKKKEVIEELEELIRNGVVEESTSGWASPIVVVQKKDGSNRLCIDYRKLNARMLILATD